MHLKYSLCAFHNINECDNNINVNTLVYFHLNTQKKHNAKETIKFDIFLNLEILFLHDVHFFLNYTSQHAIHFFLNYAYPTGRNICIKSFEGVDELEIIIKTHL